MPEVKKVDQWRMRDDRVARHPYLELDSAVSDALLGRGEFYGLVKAAGAGLGHQSIMQDFGLKTPVRVWTDSSAAIGISTRSGLGKLRHLETHTLWVQEKVRTGAIEVRKVRGDVNPADLFTKHLPSKDKIHQLVGLFGCEYRSG